MTTTNGITTLGNRTFLFGGASGIDTSALITAAYNQRKAEADKIDLQVTKNTSKYDAYDKMRTMAKDIQTSLTNIKKNYSVLAGNTALFDQRTGTLSSSSATNASSLVTVSIDPATELGSFSLEVISKAKVHKVGSDTTFTDSSADLGYTGSFDIGLNGKTASTINVTSDMSLSELATAINSQYATTGVKASVVQATSTNYQLVLTGTDTSKPIEITNTTGTNVMQSIGLLSGTSTYPHEIQQATQAQVNVDGVSYFRDNNNFDDVIPGVNLTVKNAEPGTTIDLQVENDNSTIKTGIQSFIDSYNTLRDFVKSQQVVSDSGTVDDSVVLFGDRMLNTLNLSLQGLLGRNYGSGGTTLSTLREVGITLDADNKLVMDETAFDTALIDKFDEVRGIFQTSTTSDNTEFRMSKNTSTSGSMSFAMDITYSGGAITGVSVGGDNSLFTVSGQTITGNTGTIYEGMTFAYIGTTSTTVNFSIDDGFADNMDTVLNRFSDSLSGDLTKEMTRISEENTRLEARSTRVLERASDFRDKLIAKYAGYESQMSAAQTTLAQIQAILNSNNSDN